MNNEAGRVWIGSRDSQTFFRSTPLAPDRRDKITPGVVASP
ncbi:hypothetical protein AVEN_167447-1, partial [Araneus ventricosus]